MINLQQHNYSFWEADIIPPACDVAIVGGGLVGISAALELKRLDPNLSIIILEKEAHGHGASSKNAGFVCFGSPSEIISDLKNVDQQTAIELIRKRYQGIDKIKKDYNASSIHLEWEGALEVFTQDSSDSYEECIERLDELNGLVEEATGIKDQFSISNTDDSSLHNLTGAIRCKIEGALHPGLRMKILAERCRQQRIFLLRSSMVTDLEPIDHGFLVQTALRSIRCRKVVLATNGFVLPFLSQKDVSPSMNQVYLTTPVSVNLQGTYHSEEGYIYFRKVNDRILIGGARNHGSPSHDSGFDPKIQEYLMNFLKRHIRISQEISFEHRWMGQLGVGASKTPIVEEVAPNLWRAVRLGGMGVAIGEQIGVEVAQKCFYA